MEREKGGGTRDRFSRGDMETPQHGNGSKIIFEEFPFFFKFEEIPQKFRIVE